MWKALPAVAWPVLAAILFLLATAASFPRAVGLSRTDPIEGVKSHDGFALVAELPAHIGKQRGRDILFLDTPVLLEDARPLAHPNSQTEHIVNAGRGRYQISGGKVYFSTSDGEPATGRTYLLKSAWWSLPEIVLLALWIPALCAGAIALRSVWPRLTTDLHSRAASIVSISLAAAFVVAFCLRPFPLSDLFFDGLGIPALWALLMGMLTLHKTPLARVALILTALMPAVAGYIHYGINGASGSSFIVAGIIPFSDARIHFLQAAEIAIQGTTQQMFNGRFLYPAFYSVLLDLSGLNVLVANLLVSILVMLAIVLTCPLVARRVGTAGTAVYCLLLWLYFRTHGCGLLMTENLGLLLGIVGFGFLLLSVDRDRIWPVFVAIAFFALASVARPGALFVLPALAVYAGLRVWLKFPDRQRVIAAAGAMAAALILIAGCFATNQLMLQALSRGETKTFGNFAFTLHGLLNDTTWITSAEEFGWDTSRVMDSNIRQIKDSPASLVHGVLRAYGDAFKKRFLFRFGESKRVGTVGLILFSVAIAGCLFSRRLRADSGWIFLAVAGILASIPFAPPWDAGERPYAATEPIQVFLVAAGASLLLGLLWKLASAVTTRTDVGPEESAKPGSPKPLLAFAAVCLLLVLPAPLLMKAIAFPSPIPTASPAWIPGSHRLISVAGPLSSDVLPRQQFADRLSEFQASHPGDAAFMSATPGDFIFGIDWNDLELVFIPKSTNAADDIRSTRD